MEGGEKKGRSGDWEDERGSEGCGGKREKRVKEEGGESRKNGRKMNRERKRERGRGREEGGRQKGEVVIILDAVLLYF